MTILSRMLVTCFGMGILATLLATDSPAQTNRLQPIPGAGQQPARTRAVVFEEFSASNPAALSVQVVPIDASGRPLRRPDGGLQTGPALDLRDPSLTFETGDLIVLRYQAPYESFFYVVNTSADGTVLAYPPNFEKDIRVPPNKDADFPFRFTGQDGTEEFVVLISQKQLGTAALDRVLASPDKRLPDPPAIGSGPAQPLPYTDGATETIQIPDRLREQASVASFGEPTSAQTAANGKCGQQCLVKKVGISVAGVAMQAFAPWLGQYFQLPQASVRPSSSRSVAFFEPTAENEVVAMTGTGPGGPGGGSEPLIIRFSLKHQTPR